VAILEREDVAGRHVLLKRYVVGEVASVNFNILTEGLA
jgi:hypothetical protein